MTKNLGDGQAWDYQYKGGAHDDIMEFLTCESCQVGVSNRQTRLLAGLYTTGVNDEEVDDEVLLTAALKNLEQFVFIGIMERYTDSMLLLKRTFGDRMKTFTM